jgi:hypothetical protein
MSARVSARQVVVLALVPGAIAAAFALIWLRIRFQPPTVAAYVASSDDDAGELALPPDGHFEMAVRPAAPVQGAVGARGFLLRGDVVRPWDAPFVVSTDGTVRIAGAVDQLFAGVPLGPWEVAIAVGRPEVLPTAPHDVSTMRDHGLERASWHLVLKRVRLIPAP